MPAILIDIYNNLSRKTPSRPSELVPIHSILMAKKLYDNISNLEAGLIPS